MQRKSLRTLVTAFAAVVMLCGAGISRALADSEDKDIEQAKNEFSSFWNVDQLMNRAAENISKRYNLNEKQRKDTHEMLTREVTKFLNEHEDIWPLVRDLARYQQMGEQPDGKIGAKLATKVLPLLREIEDTIVEANERWRDILTDEQKRLHDYDLEDMAKTFAKMNDNYRQLAEGGDGEFRVFPEPNRSEGQPKMPPRPSQNYNPAPPMAIQREVPQEHMWERYVREFRQDYRLDDDQSEAALSILKECMQRAEDYRKSKRAEFAQVEERLRDANRADLSPEARTAKTRVWVQIERALNKPIVDLFQELKDRLEPIPTEAQRAYAKRAGRAVANTGPRKTRAEAHAEKQAAAAAAAESDAAKEAPADGGDTKTPAESNDEKKPAEGASPPE
ncbi:MAG: hypothetical protein H6817_07825 [Phycisphaerales bacterium]|nr:hypothetical protein [Phycisphaerales bacterium]